MDWCYTYTGTTTVTSGTLIISGTQTAATGAVSVSAGATLGGTATMGNSTTSLTTTSTTSVLSPGDNGVGKLTIGGNASFASGVTFKMDFGASTTAGVTYDQFAINGTIAGSTAALGIQFDFSNIGGAEIGKAYTILKFSNIQSNFDASKLTMINSSGFGLDSLFGTNGWQVNSTNLQVRFTSVPEPATWALLVFSLTTAMVLRRRRML